MTNTSVLAALPGTFVMLVRRRGGGRMSRSTGRLSRRTLLRTTSASAVAAATAALGTPAVAGPPTVLRSPARTAHDLRRLFDELDRKIAAGMTRHAVPGVAVGVLCQGAEYVKG